MENDDQTPAQQKANNGMFIVGINLLVLVGYTLIFKFIEGGIILDALILFVHVLTCVIVALAAKNWMWFLGGILVLVIGVSTCTTLMTLKID